MYAGHFMAERPLSRKEIRRAVLFYMTFFGAVPFKADVSISVTELGSLLDHTGPHLEAEEYIARTFGAEQAIW